MPTPPSVTNGWLRQASSSTSAPRVVVSYGQSSHHAGTPAKARLSRVSWRWHSTSSAGVRAAQMGSPIPRARPLAGWLGATKSRQAEMIRAGLAPTSAMSAKATRSASRPRAERSSPILAALTTTSTGSSAATPRRENGGVPARKSTSPAYSSASCRKVSAVWSNGQQPWTAGMEGSRPPQDSGPPGDRSAGLRVEMEPAVRAPGQLLDQGLARGEAEDVPGRGGDLGSVGLWGGDLGGQAAAREHLKAHRAVEGGLALDPLVPPDPGLAGGLLGGAGQVAAGGQLGHHGPA